MAAQKERASGYHSPLRARQAAETRRMVLAAATSLFVSRGWAGTTVGAVATEAGTAVETVYAAFGSKSGLLTAAIDVAIAGDEDEQLVQERAEFAALGVGNRIERLTVAAAIITRALVQAVPLMGALREAAASDAAARERFDRYESDRRLTIATGLGLILGGPPPEHLVDAMWAVAGPEVYAKLTGERGWGVDTYQAWLVETGLALLEAA
jgi:AcrR family transcriptional regulator